jgi:Fe2+ transport system protein B
LATHWSLATALALLAWYVVAPQCASTLGVVRHETNSWKWTAFSFGYMLALAYLAAFRHLSRGGLLDDAPCGSAMLELPIPNPIREMVNRG